MHKLPTHLSAVIFGPALLAASVLPPQGIIPPSSAGDSAAASLLDRAVDNYKKDEMAMDLFERIERVELRKAAGDANPSGTRIVRAIPAGTGVGRIRLGPGATPTDPAAYRADLEKIVKAMDWAAQSGRPQREAYDKVAKKKKERLDLIDATRTAFLYTWLADEPRGDRMLSKYRMVSNPAYKPSSRSTAFFAKVRGFVWIDKDAAQLARVEAEVTDDLSIGAFLAKVYKGSRFMQERYEVEPGIWLPSFSQYDFDGRKLFLSFGIHERTFRTNYRRIGPPKDALPLLRAELEKGGAAAADPVSAPR